VHDARGHPAERDRVLVGLRDGPAAREGRGAAERVEPRTHPRDRLPHGWARPRPDVLTARAHDRRPPGLPDARIPAMAKLYFRDGAMNSGKSTSLLPAAYDCEERGHQILLAKPGVGTKAGRKIHSRLGVDRSVDYVLGEDDDAYLTLQKHRERV